VPVVTPIISWVAFPFPVHQEAGALHAATGDLSRGRSLEPCTLLPLPGLIDQSIVCCPFCSRLSGCYRVLDDSVILGYPWGADWPRTWDQGPVGHPATDKSPIGNPEADRVPYLQFWITATRFAIIH
jgi:hypothetical protein